MIILSIIINKVMKMLKEETEKNHWHCDIDWSEIWLPAIVVFLVLVAIGLIIFGCINADKQEKIRNQKATQFCQEKNLSYKEYGCSSDLDLCTITCRTEEADAFVDKTYTVSYNYFQ